MSNLKLNTILDAAITREDYPTQRAIREFVSGVIMDLMNASDFDINEHTNINKEDFLTDGIQELKGKSFDIDLTECSSLKIQYDAFCEFEYNEHDESENGGGMKGAICGIAIAWVETTKVTYYGADGSVFDVSYDSEIEEFINASTTIE
jgi:hypothetical protein